MSQSGIHDLNRSEKMDVKCLDELFLISDLLQN